MIHTILVDRSTRPEELRKLFRKKLMTGGAVLRLAPDLSPEDLAAIGETFFPGTLENNVNSMVLSEIAQSSAAPADLREKLAALDLGSINRALASRR